MNKNIIFSLIFTFSLFLRISEILANDEDSRERAFYALSSLRYYIEQQYFNSSAIDNSFAIDSIVFDEDNIASLWEAASSEPSIREELEKVQSVYYQAIANNEIEILQASEKQLKTLWERLQKAILSDENADNSDWNITFNHFYSYPNFDGNPYIDKKMQKIMKPFCLPLNHSLVAILENIFSQSRAIENEQTFSNAGFITLFAQDTSFICVARHPLLSGYLVKVYLDNETRRREGIPGWQCLVNRCEGAANVRNLIKKKKLKYFTVPDKWIYPLPVPPKALPTRKLEPVILIVTDMKLVSPDESEEAWKNKITTKHLDELFCILSHGFSSCSLVWNIPYTKSGKFACIDTEYPKRKFKYEQVKKFLSTPMKAYWDQLVKSGGKV